MDKEFVFNTLAIGAAVALVFAAIGGIVYVEGVKKLSCIVQTTDQKYSAVDVNLICNRGN